MPKPKPSKKKESEIEKETQEDSSIDKEEQNGVLPDDADFRRGMGCG